ncbi:hypothetical protein AVEN_263076-1, partial [Araneus ventricosus]
HYSAILEEISIKRPSEEDSNALDLDGEVSEYTNHETDFEIDVEDSPVHEEDSDSNSATSIHSTSNLIVP